MDRAVRELDRGNIIKRGIKRVLYGMRVDTNRTQNVLYRKSDGNSWLFIRVHSYIYIAMRGTMS